MKKMLHFGHFSHSLPGTIDIPTNSLALGQEMETWYPISLASTAHNEGASLRIRSKYQVRSLRILANFLIKLEAIFSCLSR